MQLGVGEWHQSVNEGTRGLPEGGQPRDSQEEPGEDDEESDTRGHGHERKKNQCRHGTKDEAGPPLDERESNVGSGGSLEVDELTDRGRR